MTAMRAIYGGLKQVGIAEEDRRDFFELVTGKRSLKAMNDNEHQQVISELRNRGFKKASNGSRRKLEGKFAPKLQALWIAAWNLGIVNNKDDKAMLAFIKRQTNIDDTRFLYHGADANKAIEGLKKWLAREANVDWSAYKTKLDPTFTKTSGYRISIAQFVILQRLQNEKDQKHSFQGYVEGIVQTPIHDLKIEADWIAVMNALGEQIRAAKK